MLLVPGSCVFNFAVSATWFLCGSFGRDCFICCDLANEKLSVVKPTGKNFFTVPVYITNCIEVNDIFGDQSLRLDLILCDIVVVHGREHVFQELSK